MACARGRGKKNRTALDTDDLIEGNRSQGLEHLYNPLSVSRDVILYSLTRTPRFSNSG
jgi:hypothetical protein